MVARPESGTIPAGQLGVEQWLIGRQASASRFSATALSGSIALYLNCGNARRAHLLPTPAWRALSSDADRGRWKVQAAVAVRGLDA